ncbi:MAG TPA: PH domain-containing protein [Micromonosporaceae bacterium]|nr:PH domain-containing protein [Micromonosporaceae bacterium]
MTHPDDPDRTRSRTDVEAERPVGLVLPVAPPVAEPTVADSAAAVAEASAGWRRLSRRMLLVHPVQELRRLLVPLIALVFIGRNQDRGELWPLVGTAAVVVLGMVRWFTTTYRVTPTQVQLRRGLLRRSTISVPLDRVRTVDITAHLLHRMLGLARITVGTGQSDREKEPFRLDALTVEAANRLRTELLHERGPRAATSPDAVPVAPVPAPAEQVIANLDPAWVRYAPFTLSGLVTIGVIVGFVFNAASQAHVDVTEVAVNTARDDLSGLPIALAVAVILLLVILAVVVLSIGGYVLAFWGFRLVRQGATLHVTRGLLTTRATTIEERRLRGAEISEPVLLRWVRGARATAITTGLRVGRGAERGGSVLLPAAPAAEVDRVAGAVLGTTAPVATLLRRHGPRARRRRYFKALRFAAYVTGAFALLWWLANWPVWPVWVSLALFVLAVPLAADRYANLGHALTEGYLVARVGSLIRRRYMLGCDAVIGWNERRTFFQRRAGVSTLTATTAAGRGRYEVLDIPRADGVALADAATPGLLTPFLAAPPPGD